MNWFMVFIAVLLGIVVYGSIQTGNAEITSPLKLKCEMVTHYTERCENQEVICYQIVGHSPALSCRFK